MTAFEQAWSLLKEDPLKNRSDQLAQTPLGQALTAAREAPKPQPLDFSQPKNYLNPNYDPNNTVLRQTKFNPDVVMGATLQRKVMRARAAGKPVNTYRYEPVNTMFDEEQNRGNEQ